MPMLSSDETMLMTARILCRNVTTQLKTVWTSLWPSASFDMQCFGQYAHARGNFARSAIPVGIEPTTETETLAATIVTNIHFV